MNALVYLLNIDQGVHEGKNRVAPNEKRKNLLGFSNTKQIAKFEVFCWNISFSENLLFLKSASQYLIEKAMLSLDSLMNSFLFEN